MVDLETLDAEQNRVQVEIAELHRRSAERFEAHEVIDITGEKVREVAEEISEDLHRVAGTLAENPSDLRLAVLERFMLGFLLEQHARGLAGG